VVATILSAQCTDEMVNRVTPELFAEFPTPQALAAASPARVEALIHRTGFFRQKTKSILATARAIAEQHDGTVPADMETLRVLPGIGRKTANVVLGHAFDVNQGVAVDTHVLRVTNRLGLVESGDPAVVEAALMKLVPRERWTRTTDLLIFHGRKICDARRPACGVCPVFTLCAWEGRQAWASGVPRHGAGTAREPRVFTTPRRTAARKTRTTGAKPAPARRAR
jgi:endonuclease-3